ncbi:ATP synthase subunit b, mitochondrial-like [Aricia agestis]|uniref:ATP synthase subunit b, mitochondrial-like n=1 Tax=Aricia agestis TaxID=91739 RepID=UPI001C2015C9|nr:ATP synthase subunit b, mitochondrial-like [Aricia agestis]
MIFLNQITRARSILCVPQKMLSHTDTCPKNPCKRFNEPNIVQKPKRAVRSGKVRLGFIPEEWFTTFHPATGVSGPYIFGLMATNYLVSKEIYILEHEYYTGISIFIMLYYASTRFGTQVGKLLDKQVDEYEAFFDQVRKNEIESAENRMKDGKEAQMMAEGQKLLIEAKKSTVTLQLEAAYRERMMMVYRSVKNRLDYLVLVDQAKTRIHHKWMVQWILENVKQSIKPELDKVLVDQAIQDLVVLADEIKKE